jgi:hypothetical protein
LTIRWLLRLFLGLAKINILIEDDKMHINMGNIWPM